LNIAQLLLEGSAFLLQFRALKFVGVTVAFYVHYIAYLEKKTSRGVQTCT